MKIVRILALALLLLARTGLAASPPPPQPDHLLLVSIDGLSWQELTSRISQLPTLQRLQAQGVSGPLESVFPSMTWAAHASLLTGQSPEHHGVPGNRFYDRAARHWVECAEGSSSLIRTPTLADAAAKRGWDVAALFWPNTGGSPAIRWNLPEVYGRRDFQQQSSPAALTALKDIGIQPLHLARIGSEESFVMDSTTRDLAVHLVGRYKPRVVLMHLLSVDSASHSYGPGSPPARWALDLVDRLLADVLKAYDQAGLTQRLAIVVVSDHGFLPVSRVVAVPKLAASLPVPGAAKNGLRIMANGHALFVYATDPASQAALPALAKALAKHADFERVIRPPDYAEVGMADPKDDPNFPDLVALARPEVLLWNGKEPARDAPLPMYGMHGHLPSDKNLLGVFLATGPGAAVRKSVNGLRAIDVTPTLMRWLGLALPGMMDGRSREDVLLATPKTR